MTAAVRQLFPIPERYQQSAIERHVYLIGSNLPRFAAEVEDLLGYAFSRTAWFPEKQKRAQELAVAMHRMWADFHNDRPQSLLENELGRIIDGFIRDAARDAASDETDALEQAQ